MNSVKRHYADRVMLCALEFGPDAITVNDLVYLSRGGEWSLQKSSYQKLRLVASELVSELERCGFIVDHDEAGPHLHAISARKP